MLALTCTGGTSTAFYLFLQMAVFFFYFHLTYEVTTLPKEFGHLFLSCSFAVLSSRDYLPARIMEPGV